MTRPLTILVASINGEEKLTARAAARADRGSVPSPCSPASRRLQKTPRISPQGQPRRRDRRGLPAPRVWFSATAVFALSEASVASVVAGRSPAWRVWTIAPFTGLASVTCRDYNLVMSDVRIADLKSRLSEHLRAVRNGNTLTVFDRDTPVARIVPYSVQPLEIRKANRRLRDLKLPRKPAKRTDSVALVIEDRRRR